jgi:hypothetical protein
VIKILDGLATVEIGLSQNPIDRMLCAGRKDFEILLVWLQPVSLISGKLSITCANDLKLKQLTMIKIANRVYS